MDIEQIKELMGVLEASKLSKLIFKKGDMELHLEKEVFPMQPVPRPVHADSGFEAAFQSDVALKGERGGSVRRDAPQEAPGTFVTSPMVGTLYASGAPDQPAFVKSGDQVHEDTVVCIIEAMKVMNEVKAETRGIITEILIDNAKPVEFGQPMFRIRPL